jgi:hypothetical protein
MRSDDDALLDFRCDLSNGITVLNASDIPAHVLQSDDAKDGWNESAPRGETEEHSDRPPERGAD